MLDSSLITGCSFSHSPVLIGSHSHLASSVLQNVLTFTFSHAAPSLSISNWLTWQFKSVLFVFTFNCNFNYFAMLISTVDQKICYCPVQDWLLEKKENGKFVCVCMCVYIFVGDIQRIIIVLLLKVTTFVSEETGPSLCEQLRTQS